MIQLDMKITIDEKEIISAIEQVADHNYFVFDGVQEIIDHVLTDHLYLAEFTSLTLINELIERGFKVTGDGEEFGSNEVY